MKSFTLFLAKLLLVVAVETYALSCPPCAELKCRNPTTCRGGKVLDICGCCLTCAKVQGEACGGQWHNEGHCDAGLSCVYRDKTKKGGIGKCEPVACKDKKCGFRQICSLNNLDQPQCTCPRKCKSSKGRPVCGYRNGKQYSNACELYRHECKEGAEIGLMPGPCKKCHYNGQVYKFAEVKRGEDPCEKCACVHGEWKCTMKPNCRERFQACTTFRDVNGETTSTCPRGQWCKVQIPGISSEGIPDVAVCVPGTSPSTAPVAQTTAEPLSKIVPEVPQQCAQPPSRGPCRGSFRRWYYNQEKNECLEFMYGGCEGNANNFNDKAACTALCANTLVLEVEELPTTSPPEPTTEPEVISAQEWNEICQLPQETGKCRAAFPRWYFNTRTKKCVKFIYGGCGGNRNNFETKDRCKVHCYRRKVPIHLTSMTSSQPTTPEPINPDIQAIEASWPTTAAPPGTFQCRNWNGEQIECDSKACYHAVTNNPDGSQTEEYGCIAKLTPLQFSCRNITTTTNRTVFVKCCLTTMCNAGPLMNATALINRGKKMPGEHTVDSQAVLQTRSFIGNQTFPNEEVLLPKCLDANSNRAHEEGDEWKPNDCTVCKCHKGTPECVATVCRHPDCAKPIRIKGQCCPACPMSNNRTRDRGKEIIQALAKSQLGTVLVSINDAQEKGVCKDLHTGQLYLVGQSWQLDECTTCFCGKNGRAACAVKMCDRFPKCKNPVKTEGQCCPVCEDAEVLESNLKCFDSVSKDYYSFGEMWQRDDCIHCRCGSNRTPLCSRTACKALDCEAPISIKGRCCPVCPMALQEGCIYETKSFLHGDWKLLSDHCTLCECQNSEWVCSTEKC